MQRIALVEDHQIVREGFKQLIELEPDMRVVAEFGSCQDTLSAGNFDAIDICIVDISLPDKNGLELAEHLKIHYPSLSIVVLSMYEQAHYVAKAISIGVAAYLSKRNASDVLIEALHSVASGNTFFSQNTLSLLNQHSENTATTGLAQLTSREKQVFELMAKGVEVKKIALCLDMAVKTAHTHRRNVMHKLNLKNAFEATQFALRNQLIDAHKLYD